MIIIVIIILITIVIMIVIIEKNCDKINSVVIITTEVIRSVLNSLFFFTMRFHKYKKAQKEYNAPKSTKSTKKYKKSISSHEKRMKPVLGSALAK